MQKEDFAGRRILLVEDNEINMEIARTLLEFRNASVDGACNGQQAVEMFRSSPPNHYDAVLMDVRMPVMDGIAATQAIRGLKDVYKRQLQHVPLHVVIKDDIPRKFGKDAVFFAFTL